MNRYGFLLLALVLVWAATCLTGMAAQASGNELSILPGLVVAICLGLGGLAVVIVKAGEQA